MLRKAPRLFDDWISVFHSKNLYDLPENLERRRQLLPLSVQKCTNAEIPELKLSFLSDECTTLRPRFRRKEVVWESRQETGEASKSVSGLPNIHERVKLSRPRAEYSFARRAVKLDIPIPKQS